MKSAWFSANVESSSATGAATAVKNDLLATMGAAVAPAVRTVRVWPASSAAYTKPAGRPVLVVRATELA